MPGIARGNGVDSVLSATGADTNCAFPLDTVTDACSNNVFVNNIGIVRIGDNVTVHPVTGCLTESPGLSSASPTVFVNGLGAGRLGDEYSDNTITSASENVFANG
jgi:uncharacterized Zn-binding protein involved in type VI secretion